MVDWGRGAITHNYITARNLVPTVGQFVGRFIRYLQTFGELRLSTTTIIGHSLGAHVAGIAGKFLKPDRIASIVGLDPARPLFSLDKPLERLANTDAEYVETIHTNRGQNGFSRPIGNAAFYPNWGAKQPGCGRDLTGTCSHSRAVILFEETITRPYNHRFRSMRCRSYDDISQQRCTLTGYAEMGGEPLQIKYEGVYYLETNDKSPFAHTGPGE